MKKENILKLINTKEVIANGKTFSISYLPTINYKEAPNDGISSHYEKMGRAEVAYTVYLSNQLINFTSQGHTINLYVKMQNVVEGFLTNAIELSGRAHLINLILMDSPEFMAKRVNYGESSTSRFLKFDLLRLQEISKKTARYTSTDNLNKAMIKADILWTINGQRVIDVPLLLSNINTEAKVISFNTVHLNKSLSINKTPGQYEFAKSFSSTYVKG